MAARISYGGSNAAHNCGTLKYVRVEFAGFELAPDNELNAITLGACGTATTIDYVQTHRGLDDGIELFSGGTVNLSHIVITQADDDAIDWDLGWNGTLQFLVVQQSAAIGDKAIEADSNKNNNEALPRTPTLWNVTLIGGGAGGGQGGIHLRRGSAMKLYNAIFMNFENFAINIDGSSTAALANAGDVTIENSYLVPVLVARCGPPTLTKSRSTSMATRCSPRTGACRPTPAALTSQASLAPSSLAMCSAKTQASADPTDPAAPGFGTSASAPVLEGGATPPVGLDRSATYIGAVGATNWLAGWNHVIPRATSQT